VSALAGARVAVVNWRDPWHSLAGGSERYAWEFAIALRDAGARVDFVTAQDRGQRRRERVDGIRVLRRGGQFTFYLYAAWYLLSRRRRLDAVVDPECGIPVFSPLFVRRRTALVLIVHHVHIEQFSTYFPAPLAMLGRFLEGWLMPRVYRRVRTVAVSESTRAEMADQLGWRSEVGILANGAELPDDLDCPVEAKDDNQILVLGRLVPHKRVDLVVRAVARLAEARPELRLDICGRGPEADRLAALVAELGVAGRVTLHGFLPEAEKQSLLRTAGLHICASDAEGWGQVVIEAAAYGVPTVARDVPGLRDSIRHDETGWLMPDDRDLAEVEQRIHDTLDAALDDLVDPAVRAKMYAACRAWASQFAWQRMRDEALQLVTEELERQR
jgi:glycosyltransferase involved in cell wall biosynthesis